MQLLGTLEIKSGVVIISDPGYKIGTWCQGKLQNIKSGMYNAYFLPMDCGEFGIRNGEVAIYHKSVNPFAGLNWERLPFDIGVDSGQAGIFDAEVFGVDSKVVPKEKTFIPEKPWYSQCCDLTLKEPWAGIIPGGVVSSSGFGDGSYVAFAAKNNNGEYVAVKIIFLSENDI